MNLDKINAPSASSLRDALSTPVGGGTLSPGRVNRAPGLVWSKKFASGGSVSKRADGCAERGKTKGKII